MQPPILISFKVLRSSYLYSPVMRPPLGIAWYILDPASVSIPACWKHINQLRWKRRPTIKWYVKSTASSAPEWKGGAICHPFSLFPLDLSRDPALLRHILIFFASNVSLTQRWQRKSVEGRSHFLCVHPWQINPYCATVLGSATQDFFGRFTQPELC